MQLDDLSNQQNGTYQSLPEPIPTAQTVCSPPLQVEPQLHQGGSFLPTAQASQENNTQPSTRLHPGGYQQPTGALQLGAFQKPAAQLHQCQPVSNRHYLSEAINLW